jgi:NADPH-dependent glutamate synthase beta subunit-like oxidoreductase
LKGDKGLKVICPEMSLDAQMVLVSIGVRPNSRIAEEAGIELGVENAIAVDRALLTSKEDIYAAGDCADAYHVVTGKKPGYPWPCGPIGGLGRGGPSFGKGCVASGNRRNCGFQGV